MTSICPFCNERHVDTLDVRCDACDKVFRTPPEELSDAEIEILVKKIEKVCDSFDDALRDIPSIDRTIYRLNLFRFTSVANEFKEAIPSPNARACESERIYAALLHADIPKRIAKVQRNRLSIKQFNRVCNAVGKVQRGLKPSGCAPVVFFICLLCLTFFLHLK